MTISEQTCDLIRHPVWCREVPEDAPYAAADTYDRLASAEEAGEHRGRDYQLEAGECLEQSVSLTLVRMFEQFEGAVHDSDVQVQLSIVDHCAAGVAASAYLLPAQVDALVSILQRVQVDLQAATRA